MRRADSVPRFVTVGNLLKRGVALEAILEAIVDEVVFSLAADRGTLYLVDRARAELFSKAAQLPELKEIRLKLGQGIAGTVAKSGRSMRIDDPYGHSLFNPAVDQATGYRTVSMLAAPITDSKGAVVGVLQVLNKRGPAGAEPTRFSPDDEQALQDLAQAAGAVLERTSLYPEITRSEAKPPLDYRYNQVIGASTMMRGVFELVDKAASTDATVILQGESGTGKGLIARAVHVNSARRDQPFVTVDCTALPPNLIESELFGHERGAFTGADRARPGKFELAHGGTVFLDEIGELPLELQSKLLRVVQDGEFERVGGSTTLHVDFRLIAATHRDLDQMVADGTFRADLYYRIRVVPILMPPLRDRGADDLRRLAGHFLDTFAKKHRRSARRFSDAALEALLAHRWPGNIRELQNCVESAVVLADGDVIESRHLVVPATTARGIAVDGGDLQRTLAQAERDYVRLVLADCGGNQSEAARRLAISRNTLARKLG